MNNHPLVLASPYVDAPCVLLYSGMQTGYSGEQNLLAYSPKRIISGSHFSELAPFLSSQKNVYEDSWFGYLGYELLHDLEKIPSVAPSYISLPRLWMAEFEHIQKLPSSSGLTGESFEFASGDPRLRGDDKISALRSNMSKAEYLAKVTAIKNKILAGECYQANLTRKFFGEFKSPPDAYSIFKRLCTASPATYSAFINTGDAFILSSSPERFLKVDADGRAESRPIKGTAPRDPNRETDVIGRARLQSSDKDRAENLMIVDLMRNDMARGCVAGSVAVQNLFEVATYATLHHMDSTITGQKRANVSTLQLVKDCFPPGSMTGAPKIRAMEICGELEGIERGVYSGALGWFGGDGSCDLSVVIRTIIIQGNRFEFQVGGGITADSDPESEWEETITKSRGICATLGILIEDIKKL